MMKVRDVYDIVRNMYKDTPYIGRINGILETCNPFPEIIDLDAEPDESRLSDEIITFKINVARDNQSLIRISKDCKDGTILLISSTNHSFYSFHLIAAIGRDADEIVFSVKTRECEKYGFKHDIQLYEPGRPPYLNYFYDLYESNNCIKCVECNKYIHRYYTKEFNRALCDTHSTLE